MSFLQNRHALKVKLVDSDEKYQNKHAFKVKIEGGGGGDIKVVNELGNSEVDATSQALVTNELGKKQDTLTEAQLAAVNSGIDSAKVGQIATNTSDIATNASDIDTIEGKIPAQASSSNQLADKDFVNSSVATNTANYISNNGEPFTSLAQLEAYSGDLSNNDYAFVVGTDSAGNTTYTRYKYVAGTQEWAEEYVLNNSSFTAEQWAAIQSGITAGLVTKLNGIEAGAEANTIDSISVNGTPVTPDANKNVNLTIDEGIKTLTEADYNWPTNNPTMVALWLLPTGYYIIAPNVTFASNNSSTGTRDNKVVPILVYQGVTSNKKTILLLNDDTPRVFRTVNGTRDTSSYLSNNEYVLLGYSVVNSLDSTSQSNPLSANQGRVLKSLVDAKADNTAFTGTDGTTAGTQGLVPAPATTDAGKFLKADGTWGEAGGGIIELTTADYNWPTTGEKTTLMPRLLNEGVYRTGETMSVWVMGTTYPTVGKDQLIIVSKNNNNTHVVTLGVLNSSAEYASNGVPVAGSTIGHFLGRNNIVDNLTSVLRESVLSAYQGKVLKDLIDALDAEVDGAKPLSGSTAPTTSTEGTLGQTYVDTSTGDIYYLSEIDETTSPATYTWEKLATGTGVNVVQTPGTSTTDVMSQNAVTTALGNVLVNGGTTVPTSSTEGQVGTQYNCVNNGEPEIYICTAVDTSTTPNTYTWKKVGLTLQLSTTDPGEGSPLADNTLLGIYE